jgi:hypothetical protein
LRIFGNS